MTSDAYTSLVASLTPVLARLRWHRRGVDALWLLTAGLLGAALGLVLTRVQALEGATPVVVLVSVLAAGAVRAYEHRRRRLDLLIAARLVERDPQWLEQLSTAVEHGRRRGPIVEALLCDAARSARSIRPRLAVVWAWPKPATISLLASALCFAAIATWLPSHSNRPIPSTAAGLRAVAAEVATHAAANDDRYLSALAARLEAIADAVTIDPLDAPTRDEVDRILDAVASGIPGLDLADLRDLLRSTEASPGTGEDPVPDGQTASGPRDYAPTTGWDATPSVQGEFRAELFDSVDEDPLIHPDALAGAASGTMNAQRANDASRPETTLDAVPSAGVAPPDAPAQLLGGAEEAGAGESQMAGGGTQPLEGEATSPGFEGATRDAVALSGSERDDGRRIEVELPPPADWVDYDARRFRVGPWLATPEMLVETDPVPVRHRLAAGRYFLPSQETAATR